MVTSTMGRVAARARGSGERGLDLVPGGDHPEPDRSRDLRAGGVHSAVDGRGRRDLVFANLRQDSRRSPTGGPPPCGAARGLHLQHLIAQATAALHP
jgi:hypothetical protein